MKFVDPSPASQKRRTGPKKSAIAYDQGVLPPFHLRTTGVLTSDFLWSGTRFEATLLADKSTRPMTLYVDSAFDHTAFASGDCVIVTGCAHAKKTTFYIDVRTLVHQQKTAP